MARVLLVGKGPPDRGGIPSYLDILLSSPLAAQHDLRFLNLAHAGVPEGGRFTAGNIGRTARDVAAVFRAARGRDVVHIHTALAPTVTVLRAGLLALAGRAGGCAVVVHAHGGAIQFWLTNRRRRFVLRLAMRPADRVAAVWTAGRDALERVLPSGRVTLVDNGVRVEEDGGPVVGSRDDRPPRILFVGLLTPRKGVLDLLAASRLLRDRGIVHELWLLGGTPDEGPAAEAEIRAALDGEARLLGTFPPEAMPARYAEADVFCLPSWWEAMPLSVLEAMASGLPVVATDVGDVARAVLDGVTGRVVPSKNPQALADALEPLLGNSDLRHRMGAAGRARVTASFSSAATAAQVSALYTELQGVR